MVVRQNHKEAYASSPDVGSAERTCSLRDSSVLLFLHSLDMPSRTMKYLRSTASTVVFRVVFSISLVGLLDSWLHDQYQTLRCAHIKVRSLFRPGNSQAT